MFTETKNELILQLKYDTKIRKEGSKYIPYKDEIVLITQDISLTHPHKDINERRERRQQNHCFCLIKPSFVLV